jgi:hypothetical protein
MIDYEIACTLRDALIADTSLSDFHSVATSTSARKVCAKAGLGIALVPLARTSRNSRTAKYDMHMAVVDKVQSQETLYLNPQDNKPPTLVYSITKLLPMTDYINDLASMRLNELWWSAPSFFWDLSQALAPWKDRAGNSRSAWGSENRASFLCSFEQRWSKLSEPIGPAVAVPTMKVIFTDIPILGAS